MREKHCGRIDAGAIEQREIWKYQIHAGSVVSMKQHAAVDDQRWRAVGDHGNVATDLT